MQWLTEVADPSGQFDAGFAGKECKHTVTESPGAIGALR
jgi:hypothetical protein